MAVCSYAEEMQTVAMVLCNRDLLHILYIDYAVVIYKCFRGVINVLHGHYFGVKGVLQNFSLVVT